MMFHCDRFLYNRVPRVKIMTMSSERFLPVIRSAWRRTIGISEKHPMTQYIFESLAEDLSSAGLPESIDAARERFEDTITSFGDIDSEESDAFCAVLFSTLQTEPEIDENCLKPGQCEICERTLPLTKHHLIPRMMHPRLKKQGTPKEILYRTADICRLCHNAVHRFFSEKELAFEYNTIEKLMQV